MRSAPTTIPQRVPGASLESMQARLAGGVRADALPLSLVALPEGQVIGVVNLVDNDDDYPCFAARTKHQCASVIMSTTLVTPGVRHAAIVTVSRSAQLCTVPDSVRSVP